MNMRRLMSEIGERGEEVRGVKGQDLKRPTSSSGS